MENEKRLLTLEDLWRVQYLTDPQLSPGGTEAAFTLRTAEGTGFRSRVCRISLAGPAPVPAEVGVPSSHPRYSPGGVLAFLAQQDGAPQIQIVDGQDGALRGLTGLRHGVTAFSWSADGSRIAFEAKVWPDEEDLVFTPMSLEERAAWNRRREDSPIVVEDLMYKFDESYGVVDGSYRMIGVIDARTGEAAVISPRGMDSAMPAWSGDGKYIGFYGYPHTAHRAKQAELYLHDLAGNETCRLTDGLMTAAKDPVAFTGDGHIVYPAYCKEDSGAYIQKLYRMPLSGGTGECLFPEEEVCHGAENNAIGRTALPDGNPVFQPDPDGQSVYFLSGWQGGVGIYRLPLDGGKTVTKVTGGKASIHSFSGPAHDKLLYIRGDETTIGELYWYDMKAGTETRLTRCNAWLDGIQLSQPEEMWARSRDGAVKIHGWVVPPAGHKPDTQYPAVLDIHGGPETFYTQDFWFEFQYLAAQGFAVVYCDPRGSAGFGGDFMGGDHAWSQTSMDDLFSFLDAAIGRGWIDPDRLGVTGGSYGGHMTNRIITTTDRFRAAVSQRNLCNLATSYGTGDMGFAGGDSNFTTMLRMLTDRAKSRSSVIRGVERIRTPLLILHATDDYRCSFEQAEQMFITMKDRNPQVPVKLVAYPGENHGLTREGRVDFQISHLDEMAAWFRRYLADGCEEEAEYNG